jgi:hypothetical protein
VYCISEKAAVSSPKLLGAATMNCTAERLHGISRRELLRAARRHHSHTLGSGGETGVCRRRDAAQTPAVEPGRDRRRPHRRVAKATGAKLYAADFRAADLPDWPSLDPEFRRRNALQAGWLTMAEQSLHRVRPHAGDPRQAREASDLARLCQGEGACAARAAQGIPPDSTSSENALL